MIKSRDTVGISLCYIVIKKGNVNNLSPVPGLITVKYD